jgi:bromodomain-containing factor 1
VDPSPVKQHVPAVVSAMDTENLDPSLSTPSPPLVDATTTAVNSATSAPSESVPASPKKVEMAEPVTEPSDMVSTPVIDTKDTPADVNGSLTHVQPSSDTATPAPDTKVSLALHRAQMKWCSGTLRTLKRHGDAGPFLQPVDPVALGIPDYVNVIKKPMDLGSVEKKLNGNEYATANDLIDDVQLMLQNCFTYNPPSHPVHVMGRNVERAFSAQLKRLPKEVVLTLKCASIL